MNDFNDNSYFELFSRQKDNQLSVGNSSYNQRVDKLNALQRAIEIRYREDIKDALRKDLGKPILETELSEVYQILGDIKHTKRHLRQWMRKQHVKTPLSVLGSSSYYIHESKGVCLIISPWNFPSILLLVP